MSGDPHFHTYDGEILHLMGDCKYVLSESIKFNDDCNFRVHVKNERRGSNQRVSWPKYVEIHIYNQSIRLGPNENVFVSHQMIPTLQSIYSVSAVNYLYKALSLLDTNTIKRPLSEERKQNHTSQGKMEEKRKI